MDQTPPPPDPARSQVAPDASVTPPPEPAPQARRSRAGKAAAIAAAAAVGVVAIGGASAFVLMRGSGDQLLDNVPASSDMVATVYLDPAASQKMNLFRLADRIPALGSREQLTTQAESAIDQILSEVGLEHDDLDWVGAQIAVTASFPDGANEPAFAVLLDSDDEEEAARTLATIREGDGSGDWQRIDHDGVEVWSATNDGAYAITDGMVVVSNQESMVTDVIDVTNGNGEAIADSEAFDQATEALPDGKLAMLYVNTSDLASRLEDLGRLALGPGLDPTANQSLQDLEALTGVAMSVSAGSNGLAMDVEVSLDPNKLSDSTRETLSEAPRENELLSAVPGNALVVAAQQGPGAEAIDDSFASAIEMLPPDIAQMLADARVTGEGGVLESLTGDIAIAATPGAEGRTPSGAFLFGTEDEAVLADAVEQLRGELTGLAPTAEWQTEEYEGVQVHTFVDLVNDSPIQPSYAVIDGAGVVGLDRDVIRAVVDAQDGDGIASSPAYIEAMKAVPAGNGTFYVDIDGIADAIRAQLPPDLAGEFERSAGETMDNIDSLVVGTEQSEDHVHVRVFVRIP